MTETLSLAVGIQAGKGNAHRKRAVSQCRAWWEQRNDRDFSEADTRSSSSLNGAACLQWPWPCRAAWNSVWWFPTRQQRRHPLIPRGKQTKCQYMVKYRIICPWKKYKDTFPCWTHRGQRWEKWTFSKLGLPWVCTLKKHVQIHVRPLGARGTAVTFVSAYTQAHTWVPFVMCAARIRLEKGNFISDIHQQAQDTQQSQPPIQLYCSAQETERICEG